MKVFKGMLTLLVVLLLSSSALASLTVIGTATYAGSNYKLIWDDNNNGNSVIWLDYTNTMATWSTQTAWAAGLHSLLTYHIDAPYSVTWDGDWRLPSTVDGEHGWGVDGTTTVGYNITTSEMGHLFYEEMGNLGYYDTSGNYPQPGWGLQNTGDFDNLISSHYWSDTRYADDSLNVWFFSMGSGEQLIYYESNNYYGLAVRGGQVSAVPIPGAVWLLGSGLLGIVGLKRKLKNS